MKKNIISLGAGLLCSGLIYAGESQTVGARMESERIVVQVNGETFTEYLFGQEHKYPFFYPVNGPVTGKSVTTWDQEPWPHHSSLYVSLDHVRSENVGHGNYWQPRDRLDTGQIFSRNARIVEADGKKVVLQDEADWIVSPTETRQLRDTRKMTIWAPSPEIRIMDFEYQFEAMEDLVLGQTGHSFFSARMNTEIAVDGGGTIVDSQGNRDEAGTREQAADWSAYYGENDGATEGLAIIQHSGNPFYPAKWFTRNYGFMSPTPFAFDGDRELKKGETLAFRYRVVVFTGDHETAEIAAWREDFEATTSTARREGGG